MTISSKINWIGSVEGFQKRLISVMDSGSVKIGSITHEIEKRLNEAHMGYA